MSAKGVIVTFHNGQQLVKSIGLDNIVVLIYETKPLGVGRALVGGYQAVGGRGSFQRFFVNNIILRNGGMGVSLQHETSGRDLG